MKNITRLLGWLGFNYCTKCGRKQYLLYIHGYDNYEVWVCPVHDREKIAEHIKFKKGLK